MIYALLQATIHFLISFDGVERWQKHRTLRNGSKMKQTNKKKDTNKQYFVHMTDASIYKNASLLFSCFYVHRVYLPHVCVSPPPFHLILHRKCILATFFPTESHYFFVERSFWPHTSTARFRLQVILYIGISTKRWKIRRKLANESTITTLINSL